MRPRPDGLGHWGQTMAQFRTGWVRAGSVLALALLPLLGPAGRAADPPPLAADRDRLLYLPEDETGTRRGTWLQDAPKGTGAFFYFYSEQREGGKRYDGMTIQARGYGGADKPYPGFSYSE